MNDIKIISFSVWGNNPKYVNAAYENLLLQPEIYPQWKCRFYVDETVPKDLLKKLENGAEVIMMPKSDGLYGLFWRFEPLKDLAIERFIVRDSDSRLSIKEAAAVKEWIESGKEFHIMRDHPQHGAYICGGMWGATSEFIKKIAPIYDEELKKFISGLTFQELFKPRGKYFNTDQPFLWRFIWPKIINSHIAHIKDLSNLRFTGNEKLFPIENPDGSFIGQIVE
ncbi:MAG: hypothetical protein PHF86_01575 [Candidatus Nanoarchaeia archaeon]|nr:hypothetical protein [Candidatus Nanoarchaeia archaeon]